MALLPNEKKLKSIDATSAEQKDVTIIKKSLHEESPSEKHKMKVRQHLSESDDHSILVRYSSSDDGLNIEFYFYFIIKYDFPHEQQKAA